MIKGEIPRLPLLSPCKIASYKWAPLIQRSLGTSVDWNGGVWLPSSAVSGHFAMLLQYVDFLPNAGCLLTFWFPDCWYKLALLSLPPPFPPSLLFPPSLFSPSQPTLLSLPPNPPPEHFLICSVHIYIFNLLVLLTLFSYFHNYSTCSVHILLFRCL